MDSPDAGSVGDMVDRDELHESERAILDNEDLRQQTIRGLENFTQGHGVSSDWLFEDPDGNPVERREHIEALSREVSNWSAGLNDRLS